MFNVAVIRLKDILRFFILGIVAICVIFILNKKSLKKIDIGQKVSANIGKYVKESVNIELPTIEQTSNTKQEEKTEENKLLNLIIGFELGIVNAEKTATNNIKVSSEVGQNVEEKDKQENNIGQEKNEENKEEQLENQQEVEFAEGKK